MRGLFVLVVLCAASLLASGFMAWRLSSAGDEIARLELAATNLRAARQADNFAQTLRDKLYQEAHDNAQEKYDALENIPDGLPDADWLDALRRGLRPQGGDCGADAAGKPDAANATPGATGGADAHR